MIKIAHISDLHFSKFSLSPTQFFSKRWLGNLNLLLNRGREYSNERPFSLLPLLKKREITHVIISGDLTTTSSKKEYHIAEKFVAALQELGIVVFALPGNHDHYTKRAERNKAFYRSLPSPKNSPFSLEKDGVTSIALLEGWHLVLLDTTCASSLFSSNGFFSPVVETNLKKVLSHIPTTEKIILANHFPFFPHDAPRRRLLRGEKLQEVIAQCPNIQIYLHGHTHRRTVADLRPNHLPLLLDSGSTGHKEGSWNELQLEPNSLQLKVYQWKNSWEIIDYQNFSFVQEPWYAAGLRFKCTGCGKCCTKKGYVWLAEEDINRLALHLGLSVEEFLKKYTKNYGFDVALMDNKNSDDCIFLRDKKFCSVYEARPKQCRTFPWWPHQLQTKEGWEEVKRECEGIDHEDAPLIPLSEIQKQLER